MSRQANLVILATLISGDVKNFILLMRTRGSMKSLCLKKLLASDELPFVMMIEVYF